MNLTGMFLKMSSSPPFCPRAIMISLVVLAVCLVAADAQGHHRWKSDPGFVRILNDNRAQSILGDFKVKYAQEDGTNFDEVTSADGNRRGSYSYYDDKGKKHEIHYEAGKGGFRIVGGTHKVAGPAGPKPAVPTWQYPPSHAVWQTAVPSKPKRRMQVAPQPARPAVQHVPVVPASPFSYSVSTGQNQASVSYNPPAVKPQVAYQPQPQQVPHYTPQLFTPLEPVPKQPTRFFPPGNLKLQRTHQGYAYSFSS